MVYTNSLRLKTLAVTAAGLLSLAQCAPLTAADGISATASATDSASLILTSYPSLATADEADTIAIPSLSFPNWDNINDYRDVVSEDELNRGSGLFGITAEQMKTVQLGATKPALADPADDISIDQAESDFPGSVEFPDEAEFPDEVVQGKSSIEARDAPLEVTRDEIQAIKQLAKSQSKRGFWMSLLNGTPYQWELVAVRGEGQLLVLPDVIQPGESMVRLVQMNSADSHAELRYRLLGTTKEMWFTVRIHRGFPHKVSVKYGGALETVGLGDDGHRDSILDLGVERGVVSSTFYLTGVEGRFFANDAPANWMHSMMEDIGNATLRDVMLPRSHRAGMYTGHKLYGLGNRINTFTQDFSIYYQLKVGGVRVLDLRPMVNRDGSIWESHGTKIAATFHGAAGVSHDSLIAQINKFNDDYPGELIILDVDGLESRDGKKFKTLKGDGLAKLIESFKRLKHRAVLVTDQDMTKLPLADLIGSGQSAVVIRMDEARISNLPAGHAWPGAAEGFVTGVELPVHKHYSNKRDFVIMMYDQVAHLHEEHRQEAGSRALFASEFVVTQQGAGVLGHQTITDMNGPVWVMLVRSLWMAFKDAIFPNWIAMDAIRGGDLRGVAMAVNQCFVAKRCGTFGGRIPDAVEPVLVSNTTIKAINGTTLNTTVGN